MEIEEDIAEDIQRRLTAAEVEHEVKVLYACESGSRAWGFASPDSDYDVRFIYAHKRDWYLSFDIERRRDVIEYPIVDDIDIGGWDIRKALYLFTRTNGALLEWLNSPIVYRDPGPFSERLRNYASIAHNDLALRYHYSHMAQGNAGDHLSKDRVKLKKYFYILRPLLAIRFIEQGLGLPPVRFQELVDAVAPLEIRQTIADLIEVKKVSPELGASDAIPELNDFIYLELQKHEGVLIEQGRPDSHEKQSVRDELNDIFRQSISEAFGYQA
ncbi:nucleotidyltransferase domain-containing protein [bacterium]|nr:nucleotidyltransferase domain-containing protein [bacterium]